VSIFLKFNVYFFLFSGLQAFPQAVPLAFIQACLRALLIAFLLAVWHFCIRSGFLSGRISAFLTFRPLAYPSGGQETRIASVHTFTLPCNLAFLHSCNHAGRIAWHLECVPSALPEG